MDAARGPEASVVVRPAPRHRVGARGCGRYTLLRRIRLVAYGARLEIVLGVKALAGSNPASSASCQAERRLPLSPGGPAFSAPDPAVCADRVPDAVEARGDLGGGDGGRSPSACASCCCSVTTTVQLHMSHV